MYIVRKFGEIQSTNSGDYSGRNCNFLHDR